jgi:hypothetical protein
VRRATAAATAATAAARTAAREGVVVRTVREGLAAAAVLQRRLRLRLLREHSA